jgi:hypothetical protein
MSTQGPGQRRRIRPGLGSALLLLACTRTDVPVPVSPGTAAPTEVAARGGAGNGAEAGSTTPAEPLDPPRLLTDPGSGVTVVWAGAAVASAVAGAELVVVEPDLRHLSAYDWRDGEPRWRTELPVSAAVWLHGLDDRVVLHDRDRAIVVEAARGRVIGRHPAPAAGRWPYVHTVQQRGGGACAWVGPCGIRAFACADGSPLGEYLASEETHLYGMSEDPSEHDTVCSPAPRLLGRHGATIVLVAHLPAQPEHAAGTSPRATPSPRNGAGPAIVGLAADTGAVRWHHPLATGDELVGLTDDGACWVVERQGPRVRVLEPDTGALRWERAIGPGTLDVHAFAAGLVVGREHGGHWRLSAYDLVDGGALWSTRLARRERPAYFEGTIPGAQATGARRAWALVDPVAGRVAAQLVAGRDETLWRDPAGGFLLIGRDLRELDDEGRLVRQRALSSARVHTVTTTHVLGLDGDAIEIFDRDQLRERARLEGRLSIDASARLPDGRLLLQRYGEDGVALVLGLEPPARGGRR